MIRDKEVLLGKFQRFPLGPRFVFNDKTSLRIKYHGILFFDSTKPVLVLSPCAYIYPRRLGKETIEAKKDIL